MRNLFTIVLALSVVIIFGCGPENLQRSNLLDPEADGVTSIAGKCLVGTLPVAGVSIYTNPTSKAGVTDSNGWYTLTGLAAGSYSVVGAAPWYAAYTSTAYSIASGSRITVNMNIATPNYQAPCIPEDFETYTSAFAPPTPWNTSTSGGTVLVIYGFASSGSKSCSIASWASAGNYGKLQLFQLNAAKGVRVSAKIKTDNVSAVCNVKIGVTDTSSKTTEFGIDGYSATRLRYILPTGVTTDPNVANLVANTWYTLFFELDYETKTAIFELSDQYKTTSYFKSGSISFSGAGLGAIDKFYISNTLNGSGSSVGAIVDGRCAKLS